MAFFCILYSLPASRTRHSLLRWLKRVGIMNDNIMNDKYFGYYFAIVDTTETWQMKKVHELACLFQGI